MEKERLTPHQIDNVLNKKSGLLGVSGISNDMRRLILEAKKGDRRARLAIDMFVYRIKKYIGAYLAVMNGLDAVVLTAGIGENNPWLLKRLKRELLNVVDKFKVKILVIPTKEEWMIAMETYNLIESKRGYTRIKRG